MLRFNVKCLLIFSILCYLTHPVLSDCRNAFVQDFDYFPDKISFENDGKSSSDLSVVYYKSYIVVTNRFSYSYNETYVLYCTAEQPVLTDVPVDSTNYIQIPVTNVAVSDRAIISFLEILGEERSIKYVADKSQITSPCLQRYNGLYDTLNFANTPQIQGIDVIFTHTPLTGGKYVQVSFDDSPALRKAEWIKFVSLFYNKTAIANEIFSKIQSNYLCHTDNLSNVPIPDGKTIAWVSLESDLTFTIRSTPFYVNITDDAAGFILDPQITEIQTTDELHQNLNDAYIVIDMSELTAPHNTLDSWKHYFGYDNVSTLPKFLKKKRLYRTHKLLNNNGYDDWTESSGPRPDLVLQDLIAMQYPLYQPDYKITWFDKFAETGDIVVLSGDNCNESTFGFPKTDFGTCEPAPFFGNKNHDDHKHDNNGKGKKEKKVKAGVIIGVSLTGSLVLLGLGAWAFVVARRKYRERFVKLRDEQVEPVVQMNNVKEVPLDSVKEVK